LIAALIAYCVIYGWFCLFGNRIREMSVPIAIIALLVLLAVALETPLRCRAKQLF